MSKTTHYEAKNAEDVYFVSASEKTLPSEETLLEEIEKCIPGKYDIRDHRACAQKNLFDKYYINYQLKKVDANRYRISVFWNFSVGIISIAIALLGMIIGGSVGYSLFEGIGAFVGTILGLYLVNVFISKEESNDAEQACERIIHGIKEYERAHMMNIKYSK
ncbi:MAG: hypothetical protein IJQ76_07920 [Prevotella sp.]|nr:hypothetical protein [Prevotella sp.]